MLNVLILAAGLGTRLRPLTSFLPKPLVPIVDASALEHVLKKVKAIPDVSLHINAHYFWEQIEEAGRRFGFKKVWVEKELLGSAGPLYRLFHNGFDSDLLVVNGDCYTDFDLSAFVEKARKENSFISLLAFDFKNVNTLQISENYLSGLKNRFTFREADTFATFSGISYYSKEALSLLSFGENDVRDFWKRMLSSGKNIYVDLTQINKTWIDMGSPEGLFRATKKRLAELQKPYFIEDADSEKQISYKTEIKQGTVIYKQVELPEICSLENVILFPGSKVENGAVLKNEIRGKDFSWKI